MTDIMKAGEQMCNFIRDHITNKWGFYRTEEYNVDTLVWSTDRCDPDDIGDFAPFMTWFDIVRGKDNNIKWVDSQIKKVNKTLKQASGFYYPFSDGRKKVGQSIFSASYPQGHVDTLLGLTLMYKLTGNDFYLNEAKGIADAIAKYSIGRTGFVYGAVIPGLHMYYPKMGHLRHKPQVSGIFIEELAILYQITGNELYRDAAKRMAMAWENTPSFKRLGVCVDQVIPFIKKEAARTARLGKENTNLNYGLLRLYEASKDREDKESCIRGMEGLELYRDSGAFFRIYDVKAGKAFDDTVCVIENHMAMGAFLDAYLALGDKKYLKIVEECADVWIGLQHKNGLFPRYRDKKGIWNHCDIDPHLDMVTMLCKLYFVRKKKKYKDSIKKGAEAVNLFKNNKDRYYNRIYLETGKPVNPNNELKFLGGSLKGIVSAYTTLNNIRSIDKETLRLLMRDR